MRIAGGHFDVADDGSILSTSIHDTGRACDISAQTVSASGRLSSIQRIARHVYCIYVGTRFDGIVVGRNGDALFIWTDYYARHAFFRTRSRAGKLSPVRRIEGVDLSPVDAAVGPNGAATILLRDFGDGENSPCQVLAQQVADGAPTTRVVVAAGDTTTCPTSDHVAVTPNGTAVISWTDQGELRYPNQILARTLSSAGALGPVGLVAPSANNDDQRLVATPSGQAVFIWGQIHARLGPQHEIRGTTTTTIKERSLTPDGSLSPAQDIGSLTLAPSNDGGEGPLCGFPLDAFALADRTLLFSSPGVGAHGCDYSIHVRALSAARHLGADRKAPRQCSSGSLAAGGLTGMYVCAQVTVGGRRAPTTGKLVASQITRNGSFGPLRTIVGTQPNLNGPTIAMNQRGRIAVAFSSYSDTYLMTGHTT
jgi:hypothetical protein